MNLRRVGRSGALLIAPVVLFLWGAYPPAGDAQESATATARVSPDLSSSGPTPFEVFSDLERFWSLGRADSLIGLVAEDEIHLSLRRMGPRDGTFDHSQARYLLEDLFQFARTDSFFFIEFKFDPSEGDPPEAVGRWYYKGGGGIEREARVTIQLMPMPEGWAISSIDARKW
jgi:hypothetical protein